MFVTLSRMPMRSPFDNEARYYDIFHQDKDYRSEAKRIRAEFPDVRTVLEIGCGTGNLTRELENLGFEITCLEPSGEMLKYFKGSKYQGKRSKVIQTTIQDYAPPKEKFDLVLATYDALNYIPHSDYCEVVAKILKISKDVYAETWDRARPVCPLTYKRTGGCHRLRLGFKFGNVVYLWFVFWGQGPIVVRHKLYLHRLCP